MGEKIPEYTCQTCGEIKTKDGKRKPRCCGEVMFQTGWVTEQQHIRRTEGKGQAELSYY